MKKIICNFLIPLILCSVFFTACASKKAAENPSEPAQTPSAPDSSEHNEILYVPETSEMQSFISNWTYLKNCDEGKTEVTDDQIKVFYSVVGRNDLISLQMEIFLLNVKNKDIQKKVEAYIKKNKLNSPFDQALLKKYRAVEKKYDNSGHEEIQYSYKNEEFDENITLYDFNDIPPFNDEFGLLLFNNNWGVVSLKNEDGTDAEKKHFYLIHGGGTNCLTISFDETENISTREEFGEIINGFIQTKRDSEEKDEWDFYNLGKDGILYNCGVDDYIIYSRIGPDIIPEISSGKFGAYLYSEKYAKVYKVEFFINFSTINISYEIRQRIYDYVRFFTLFCYCD